MDPSAPAPLPRHHRHLWRTAALGLAIAVGAGAAACGGSDDEPAPAPEAAPRTPLEDASDWVLDQLAGGEPPWTVEDVRAHFAAEFLDGFMPPDRLLQVMEDTHDELGDLRFVRYDFPPLERSLVAIVSSDSGFDGAVHLRVDDDGKIVDLQVQEAPPARPREDADTGWFATSAGRTMYVHCSGDGTPVILDGGVWSDWEAVRAELADEPVRVCSFDRPAAFGSASTPVPTPRTGAVHVDDLRAALAAAGVEGPYLVVGHSNSALFDQLWAIERPDDLRGLVLVDPVTQDYGARRVDALADLLPPEQVAAMRAESEHIPPPSIDPEQLDIPGTQRLLGERWTAPIDVPAVVITHGKPTEYPPDWPVEADEALWRELHRDLVGRFAEARLVVAEESGHDIHREQPAIVAGAVTSLVAAG